MSQINFTSMLTISVQKPNNEPRSGDWVSRGPRPTQGFSAESSMLTILNNSATFPTSNWPHITRTLIGGVILLAELDSFRFRICRHVYDYLLTNFLMPDPSDNK